MRNLHAVLTNDYGLDLTGWQLSNARGIAPDGQTIVGCGFNPAGQREGWIASLKPPCITIRRAGGCVTVSWETNAPGFAFEQTDSLSSSAWHTNAAPISISGNQCVVTNHISDPSCFFRLWRL